MSLDFVYFMVLTKWQLQPQNNLPNDSLPCWFILFHALSLHLFGWECIPSKITPLVFTKIFINLPHTRKWIVNTFIPHQSGVTSLLSPNIYFRFGLKAHQHRPALSMYILEMEPKFALKIVKFDWWWKMLICCGNCVIA